MLPARRPRPRHAAPSTPSAAAVPAGLLLSAVGIVVAGLSSSPTPSAASPLAPQPAALAVAGGAPSLPAERIVQERVVQERVVEEQVVQEQVERRAAEQRAAQAAEASARAVAAQVSADRRTAVRDTARASRSERRPETVRPVAKGPLTSPFGHRWGRLHAGLDFGVPVGTPVLAVADGVVEKAQHDGAGYGHYVVVRHADGTSTLYAHLSKVVVGPGHVQAGDVIGRSGNTGHSTGPHLHFEVRSRQDPVDPRPWLRKRGVTV